MILADLDVWHSRRVAPTRRIAVGDANLPMDPAPGAGAVLLGGIVAAHSSGMTAEEHDELTKLAAELERGARIAQPRLRFRLQEDRVGLTRSRHRLIAGPDGLRFDLELQAGAPQQHVLAAMYAAAALKRSERLATFKVLRTAMNWSGSVGPALAARLGGRALASLRGGSDEQITWALRVLDLQGVHDAASSTGTGASDALSDAQVAANVQRRYRDLLRAAHPDHGGEDKAAAARIEELREARRILLS